ncbi:MAG: sigma 54-interacting transcriptional regulator, partial [Blastocatellia bacterium]
MSFSIKQQLADSSLPRYQTMLEVAEVISAHRDLSELFHDLAPRLRRVIRFDYINVVLHDAERGVMCPHVLETPVPDSIRPIRQDCELPIEQSPGGWVWQHQRPLIVPEISKESRFPEVFRRLREHGLKSFYLFPLTSVGQRLGALGLGSTHESVYNEAEWTFLQDIAKLVAVGVDNALNFGRAQAAKEELARERDHLRLLLEVNNAVVSTLDLRELFEAVSASLRRVIAFDYASLALYDPESNQLRLHALGYSEGKGGMQEDLPVPLEGTPAGLAFTSRQAVLVDRLSFEQFPSEITNRLLREGFTSGFSLPLISPGRVAGVLNVASRREQAFTQADVELIGEITGQIAIAIENALSFHQIVELQNKLAGEKLYLEDEIRVEYDFEEIIGLSQVLRRLLQEVETVAPTDSTVLIQGETGTGKELIARAIHDLSARRERTLVKVNCAAIPTGLLESELFGHEKGAFTGASAQRVGRFELAHRGTLFLDEVGDIPLELQPKLLRVLQEQEFERLGSSRTIRVDARLVAATNADLEQMVAGKQFRGDLYYRLNVFPITIPPLRERREDIPLLVRYFVRKYARRMKRRIEAIPTKAMAALSGYSWPGNVRELENFIERAVILSRGSDLEVPLAELKKRGKPLSAGGAANPATLADAEREHILRTLQEANWVIS